MNWLMVAVGVILILGWMYYDMMKEMKKKRDVNVATGEEVKDAN